MAGFITRRNRNRGHLQQPPVEADHPARRAAAPARALRADLNGARRAADVRREVRHPRAEMRLRLTPVPGLDGGMRRPGIRHAHMQAPAVAAALTAPAARLDVQPQLTAEQRQRSAGLETHRCTTHGREPPAPGVDPAPLAGDEFADHLERQGVRRGDGERAIRMQGEAQGAAAGAGADAILDDTAGKRDAVAFRQ
jgi:hypothetical protein